MDQPQDNKKGYDATNPISYIDQYQGGLFLIHGSADDNVHLSNSMQMAFALQNSRKPFEMMVYPGKKHSISGRSARIHLYKAVLRFLERNLGRDASMPV